MDYHDKAIKSMLDNLGLMTSSTNTGTNMNLHPMYSCPFNNEEDEGTKSTEKEIAGEIVTLTFKSKDMVM